MKWVRFGDGGLRGVEWLSRPLLADGVLVAGPLDPDRLIDSNLRDICLRMHAVLNSEEMPRCEGRHLPIGLFNAIDDLADRVLHNGGQPPRLAEWAGVIGEFGAHYGLEGAGPLSVHARCWREAARWLGEAKVDEPSASPDGRATTAFT